MIVTQCDNCKTLGPAPAPPGWIGLTEVSEEPAAGLAAALSGGGHGVEMAGLFCSWRCAGAYATAKALIESAGSGEGSP